MTESARPTTPGSARPATPRQVADAHVAAVCALDPITATALGTDPASDRLPDTSPAGLDAEADLDRATLDELERVLREDPALREDPVERRCARLLRERLTASLAQHQAGEGLRQVSNLFSPLHSIRQVFSMMPTATEEDWSVLARRLARVPEAYRGYRESLTAGADRGLFAAPRQVHTVVGQLGEWLAGPYFASVVAAGPDSLRTQLDDAARLADGAVAEVRDFLRDEYAPRAEGTPDAVGRERYARFARSWNGTDLGAGTGLEDAYAWGWAEHQRILVEQRAAAHEVLAGATPMQAMRWLDEHGESVQGVEQVRQRLQAMMDEAMDALDGTHFSLAEPIRRVEAMIAPPGSAAAPYYTRPTQDFSRPGRTWLPTLGRERFPLWDLVSTWYHEGVPGHHLQLAQWAYVSGDLSTYQTSLGSIGANVEGWALYAERLMDELGFLTDPGARLGYLDAQQMRAVRVVVDIGMHLELPIPDDAEGSLAEHRGKPWTPELARAFFGENCGRDAAFLDSELVRYLGMPGQAISYKLGERAWLAGREAARRAHGDAFDLKAWHMAALSQGSLGLDDLERELAEL
ncbi:DUF885 family protein [Modestobacter sp. I12A-02628]|uniref:DUF885 domain-containing protein n=1 Tax=Goekera deserti TaxID=2497753 RepID=A0A7K3W8U6_9ACTN|nr:DUF885 domain-containing protein [Goekera deserti]MPR00446.1 DUF885 family protein [Goekera deserti]NDI49157.1 DUF885 family protein [Goekera deserti]NEL52895.1 DUF885 domain-containing protein [Goekera deserti]